jgi:heme/copper-type cytochrome/quinol oxidase subunit 3
MTTGAVPYRANDVSLPEAALLRHPPGWWGMVWLCATEGMLFACLIASYFFLRGSAVSFYAEGGHYPSLRLPLPMTAILLASSATMWWGERGIKRGEQGRLRIGLAVTFVLGVLFLLLQAREYHNNLLGPTVSAYHSIFYTTTGLHGAHVALGLLMNAYVQLRAAGDDTGLGDTLDDRRRFMARFAVGVSMLTLFGIVLRMITALFLSPSIC